MIRYEKARGKWYKVGYLPTGAAVFCGVLGELAVEVHEDYLGEMTEEEKRQVLPERGERDEERL